MSQETQPDPAQADEVKLHNTLDANIWAKEFIRLQKKFGWEVDLDMMRGWFANAIMVGYDHSRYNMEKRVAEQQTKIDELEKDCCYFASTNPFMCKRHLNAEKDGKKSI